MITDPVFYALAVPVVFLLGFSKGGFGSGLGLLGVPLLALAVSPVIAAAILLPILCVMDLFGLWAYWRRADWHSMAALAPGALVGIGIGWATFGLLDADGVRLLLGTIALLFVAYHFAVAGRSMRPAARPGAVRAGFWSAVSGYTSTVAHAGGPPLAFYLLPLRPDKTVYVATTVVFFAFANYVKLIPYAFLGQLNAANMWTAAVLLPLAPLAMLIGIWTHRFIPQRLFFDLAYLFILAAGVKLVWDGLAAYL